MVIYALHCNIFQCFIRVVQDFLLILLVYENVEAPQQSKINNVVAILPVATCISLRLQGKQAQ